MKYGRLINANATRYRFFDTGVSENIYILYNKALSEPRYVFLNKINTKLLHLTTF